MSDGKSVGAATLKHRAACSCYACRRDRARLADLAGTEEHADLSAGLPSPGEEARALLALVQGRNGGTAQAIEEVRQLIAVPPPRGKPKPPKEPRTPRVVELLRKAIEWQGLLEAGEASNQAAIARREGITRARVTQVMGLLRLAPEIQEHILSLPDMVRRPAITERALRPIAALEDLTEQKTKFHELIQQAE